MKICIVCSGNFDNSFYYLNANGSFNKEVKSENYSDATIFGDKLYDLFDAGKHIANFLRPIPQDVNNDHLAVLATNNSMQVKGTFYQFEPLESLPIQISGASTNAGVKLNTSKQILVIRKFMILTVVYITMNLQVVAY